MKQTIANEMRATLTAKMYDYLLNVCGEDVGYTASGTLNFPIVSEDGTEGWAEIKIAIPKYEDEEGFELRKDYEAKLIEAKEKEEARKEAKAKRLPLIKPSVKPKRQNVKRRKQKPKTSAFLKKVVDITYKV